MVSKTTLRKSVHTVEHPSGKSTSYSSRVNPRNVSLRVNGPTLKYKSSNFTSDFHCCKTRRVKKNYFNLKIVTKQEGTNAQS